MTLVAAVRDHLISNGIGRMPRTAGSLPPIWVEPINGVPAPGEGQGVEVGTDAVIGLFDTIGVPSGDFEAWRERRIIEVWARHRTAPGAKEILRASRVALIGGTVAPTWGQVVGGIQISSVNEWTAMQTVGPSTQGYTWQSAFLFDLLAAAV